MAVSLVEMELVMAVPGAYRSRQEPQLLNEDRMSAESEAPTVMAEGAEAGDVLHASEFSLPAATATIIPAARMEAMPRFIEDENPPPIDILATHLRVRLLAEQAWMTWSMPERMPDHDPDPASLRTLTAHTWAAGATPNVEPAIVPAQ